MRVMMVSVAGRFFGHAYFHLPHEGVGRGGGVFELEEGAGAIDGCCTASGGQPKREREMEWEAGLYLNSEFKRP